MSRCCSESILMKVSDIFVCIMKIMWRDLKKKRSSHFGDIRDLKIRGREQLGRLPEVNLPTRACARELLSRVFAVVVSSRTAF